MKGYIYKITNADESIVYVGSTTYTLQKRFDSHKRNYKRWVEDRKNLLQFEQLVIDSTKCVNKQAAWISEERRHEQKRAYRIGTSGVILAGSGCYTTSDARIKKDFTPLSDDIADSMLHVEPLLFRYKNDDNSIPLQLGYKAHDLLRVGLPHCINFSPNENLHVEDPELDTEGIQYSVDYSKMVCLLHKLVLKQQKQLDNQQNQINELISLISERV
ncbi:Intramolecular chaperone auto-processing domain [Phytophthora cactorum]|nr:Intramolecular chaperone auto-processing domain [Phytophthora cactorum]